MSKPTLSFLPLGANLFEFTLPSRSSLPALPLVLSLPNQSAYTATTNPAYFGETIGRVGNRIKSAQISLNSTTYTLPANNGPNTLHGGPKGWGKQLWSGPFPESRRGTEGVRFELTSPDGDQGFPGTLLARAWYLAREEGGKTELEVEYEVVFAGEAEIGKQGEQVTETAVNVTNHTAFSIGPLPKEGESRSIEGTRVRMYMDKRQEVDGEAMPTGKVTRHEAVEVGKEIVLGKEEPKFDDCFVMDEDPSKVPLDTRKRELKKMVDFWHPETKVRFEVESTEPAFQFYTGEFIDLEYEGQKFSKRSGFCVEASRYVDAASKDEWRGQVLMKRGETWGSRTIYRAYRDE